MLEAAVGEWSAMALAGTPLADEEDASHSPELKA